MNIAVFCGSSPGNESVYTSQANKFGRWMGRNNHQLIYGGASIGVMGAVADGVVDENGKAIGIIPEFLERKEVAHNGLTNLVITESMHERKQIMADRSDVFVVMAGGFGTFEEMFEIITWNQLDLLNNPIFLLNTNGYYDPFIEMIDKSIHAGFIREENRSLLTSVDTVEALIEAISSLSIDKDVSSSASKSHRR